VFDNGYVVDVGPAGNLRPAKSDGARLMSFARALPRPPPAWSDEVPPTWNTTGHPSHRSHRLRLKTSIEHRRRSARPPRPNRRDGRADGQDLRPCAWAQLSTRSILRNTSGGNRDAWGSLRVRTSAAQKTTHARPPPRPFRAPGSEGTSTMHAGIRLLFTYKPRPPSTLAHPRDERHRPSSKLAYGRRFPNRQSRRSRTPDRPSPALAHSPNPRYQEIVATRLGPAASRG